MKMTFEMDRMRSMNQISMPAVATSLLAKVASRFSAASPGRDRLKVRGSNVARP